MLVRLLSCLLAMCLWMAALVIVEEPVIAEEIEQAVGDAQANRMEDVLAIQLALNQLPADVGGSATQLLVPDGIFGPVTQRAIKRFQNTQFSATAASGSVEPGSPTLSRLTTLLAAQPLPQRMIQVALGERLYWGDGEHTELDPRVSARLKLYWAAAERDFTVEQLRQADFQAEWPWSAAFVSWVMQTAGAGDQFHYTDSHWQYVATAKHHRETGTDNPIKAYRIPEQTVTVGDIIVKRRSTSTATYENVEKGHPTHGDIVVAIHGTEAITIGGNVSNSVRTTLVQLSDSGHVANDLFFAILKTNVRSSPPK